MTLNNQLLFELLEDGRFGNEVYTAFMWSCCQLVFSVDYQVLFKHEAYRSYTKQEFNREVC